LFDHPAPSCFDGWETAKKGKPIYKNKKFDTYKRDPDKVLNTITASYSKARSGALHYSKFRMLTKTETYKSQTFPQDYESKDPLYMCGMSVPPVMTAQIASEIYRQWQSIF